MKKKLVCLLLGATLILSGCAEAPDEKPEPSMIKTIEGGTYHKIIVDDETGVMYLKWSNAGIVPMFNADGTLKIWGGE